MTSLDFLCVVSIGIAFVYSSTVGQMRFVVFIYGLCLAAGVTFTPSHSPEEDHAPDYVHDRDLTELEIENICPAIQGKSTLEAGAEVARFFVGSSEGVPEHELEFIGRDMILKCVRATCLGAVEGLARAIAVHDPNGTVEGMKKAIGSIGAEGARELYEYTELLTPLETADVVLDLYPRARMAANLGHIGLMLTREDMEIIGSYARVVFFRF